MLKYYKGSITYNKKNLLLILSISILGFSFIFLILQLLNSLKNIADAESDYVQMIYLIIIFFVIIGASIVGFLNTAYKILYQGRILEIKNLRYIGCSKSTIKRIFITEIIILSLIVSLSSMIIGSIFSKIFTSYFDETITMEIKFVVLFLLLTNSVFTYTVYYQFNIYLKAALDITTRIKMKNKKKKKSISNKNKIIIRVAIGIILILAYLLVKNLMPEYFILFKLMEEKQVDLLMLIIICFLYRKPTIYGIFALIYKTAEKYCFNNLLLAMKRIIDDKERMMKLITNLALSICFMIFFLVMFQSTSMTSIHFIQKGLQYEHMYLDETTENSEIFSKAEESIISKALILPATVNIKNKYRETTLKGVSSTYLNAEKIEMLEGSWNNLFQKTTEFLPILISNIDSNNYGLSIGDTINCQILDVNFNLKVVGVFNSYGFGEILASQKGLSLLVSQDTNTINTWYTSSEIIGTEKHGIIHKSSRQVIDEAEDSILSGTEIIYAFLYLYVISSMFMLFNIFLITLKDRKACNHYLKIIGLKSRRIFLIQLEEILLVSLLGITTGIFLGFISILGLPAIFRLIFNLRIHIYIPISIPFIISGIILFSVMVILVICYKSTKPDNRLEEEVN